MSEPLPARRASTVHRGRLARARGGERDRWIDRHMYRCISNGKLMPRTSDSDEGCGLELVAPQELVAPRRNAMCQAGA